MTAEARWKALRRFVTDLKRRQDGRTPIPKRSQYGPLWAIDAEMRRLARRAR